MDYIHEGKVSDEYTKELENTVESLREDDGSEAMYMTYQQTIMEHEIKARNEGRNEGRIEAIKDQIKAGLLTLAAIKASGLYTEQEIAAISAP